MGRWNHNIHYHRLILDAVPAGASSALDVGCGNGLLSTELHSRVSKVAGIDLDAVCSMTRVSSATRSSGCMVMP